VQGGAPPPGRAPALRRRLGAGARKRCWTSDGLHVPPRAVVWVVRDLPAVPHRAADDVSARSMYMHSLRQLEAVSTMGSFVCPSPHDTPCTSKPCFRLGIRQHCCFALAQAALAGKSSVGALPTGLRNRRKSVANTGGLGAAANTGRRGSSASGGSDGVSILGGGGAPEANWQKAIKLTVVNTFFPPIHGGTCVARGFARCSGSGCHGVFKFKQGPRYHSESMTESAESSCSFVADSDIKFNLKPSSYSTVYAVLRSSI